jgi:hypothetical protein
MLDGRPLGRTCGISVRVPWCSSRVCASGLATPVSLATGGRSLRLLWVATRNDTRAHSRQSLPREARGSRRTRTGAPVPPSWPLMSTWSAWPLTTPDATTPTPASDTSFTDTLWWPRGEQRVDARDACMHTWHVSAREARAGASHERKPARGCGRTVCRGRQLACSHVHGWCSRHIAMLRPCAPAT